MQVCFSGVTLRLGHFQEIIQPLIYINIYLLYTSASLRFDLGSDVGKIFLPKKQSRRKPLPGVLNIKKNISSFRLLHCNLGPTSKYLDLQIPSNIRVKIQSES